MNVLVFAGDDGAALGMAVAISSAVRHLSVPVDVCVLDTGMSSTSRERLARAHRAITWVQVPMSRLSGLPIVRYLTLGMYARLLIPELLPAATRAVYLDADVIVRSDLAPLFTLNLGEAPIAAVRDFETHSYAGRPSFNSGVLVLDCPHWRATQLGERALEYVEANAGTVRHPDQEALLAVNDDWVELDWCWNIQQALSWAHRIPPGELTDGLLVQRESLYRRAAVIHFSSTPKPWYHACRAPGTWSWIGGLARSRYFSRSELIRWIGVWCSKRAAALVLTALRSCRCRLPHCRSRAGGTDQTSE